MKRYLPALLGFGLLAAPVLAQTPQASPSPKPEDETVKLREEIVVVSASKTESTLVNAPATISVLSAETIESSPAQNYGDLLRSVPGLNVIQTSARDINITSRQATSTLTNSQLVLLDGRSIYLDFFGLVLWDFLPQSTSEIKQIEVVRGPASAVWGANALTGVVNVITKTPREAEGFNLNLSAGLFNRDGGSREDDGSGYQYGGNFSIARAPSEKTSFRLSAGYFNSDPYSRPQGVVPFTTHPLDSSVRNGGGIFPGDSSAPGNNFENEGTSQPKVDLRIDRDFDDGGRLTLQGGYSGTDGLIHTGFGPFDIQSPSWLAYPKVQYTKGALRVAAFANITDVEAPNLLARDPDSGQPVVLTFKTQTYDFEIGHSTVLGGKHILSYGGNVRRNNFDISITPDSEDRTEYGGYFQEEFFLDKFRVAAGLRVDKFGNLEDPVFSPRVSVMFKPAPSHSIRASFNRAFRAPSTINNYLDLAITSLTSQLIPLTRLFPPPPGASPFFLRVVGVGNTGLKEESLDAYELAYTGTVKGRTTLGLAVYQNDQDDNINFTFFSQIPPATALANGATFYSVTNPARGLTLAGAPFTFSRQFMGTAAAVGVRIPEVAARYLNLGPIRQRGLEASIDHSFTPEVNAFANYSYQRTPEILDPETDQLPYFPAEVTIPPKNRFNVGVNYSGKRMLGTLSVNYTDDAYWTDVLAPEFAGPTDAYTQVNASFGVKWMDGKLITSVKAVNLFNEEIRQHIYGDLTKLNVVFEARIYVK
jgi:outer membrane receptor protein involved in Fe transport